MLVMSLSLLASSCKGRLFPGGQGNLSGDPPSSASSQEAAQAGLVVLRSLVRQDNFQGLGFTSVDQVNSVQLSDPMKLYLIRLDGLTSYKGPAGAAALLQDAHKLIYPLTIGPQVVSSLSVTQRNDGWRATDFGSAALTRALVAHRESAADFVVWVPALKIYFTARGSGNDLVLTPIMDDPRFGFQAGEAIPVDRAFATLQKGASGYNGLPQ
jgi:hypothetical protein